MTEFVYYKDLADVLDENQSIAKKLGIIKAINTLESVKYNNCFSQ